MATCPNCGREVPDGAKFCGICGAMIADSSAPAAYAQPAAPTAYGTAPTYQPAPAPTYNTAPTYAPAPTYGAAPAYNAAPTYGTGLGFTPARQLKTNRALWRCIVFGILTLGIHSIVFFSGISSDINTVASRYDGKKTMHFCLVAFIFSWLTLGIVPLVWFTKLYGRIGREQRRRGTTDRPISGGTFWLCVIPIVGGFISIHKLCKAINEVCSDYNARG